MPKVTVTLRTGEQRQIAPEAGRSLMQAIRDAGIDEIKATCGGCCSCSTCHVIVDPDQAALLPAVSESEHALLECVDPRTPTSRLSCQIELTGALDGLHVTVAPEG